MKLRKKLIEVALPLEAINEASAREKSIRHGHPSTLHLWWARRPLAAARAVIFAQMVDDPSTVPELFRTEEAQESERQRLFGIIKELVQWENTTNERVLNAARDEILKSWRRACADNKDHPRAKELFNQDKLPAFHDPFAGGGSLPLEAQRLGLEAYASDLNPVAVLICKAMIEIPPKFAGKPPVNPESQKQGAMAHKQWHGAQGLAEDVRYYGQWMRDQARKRIGHFYPTVEITAEMANDRPDLKPYVGKKLTVIAWLWARTVRSPNPAFADVDVPLASTFMLSTKAGKDAYVEPVIEGKSYRFTVKVGKPKDAEAAKNGTKLARANFKCITSGTPVGGEYIKAQGKARRIGARLMAIVAEGERGRVYVAPTREHESVAYKAKPTWRPEGDIAARMTGGNCTPYGMTSWGDLFTPRQLVALTTFSDLVQEARAHIEHDAVAAGFPEDGKSIRDGGNGVTAYAEALGAYLGFAVSKAADRNTSLCFWEGRMDRLRGSFGRQALPMIWDYAETNPLAGAGGDIFGTAQSVSEVLDKLPSGGVGHSSQADATTQAISNGCSVSTDPPYYDNIGYADLSDFFYVWLRRTLKSTFTDILSTLAVPKAEELVATPYRHGDREKAEQFFLNGMTQAMQRLASQAHPGFPVTIYYAFKQSETHSQEGTSSTGWETFLDAVIRAGFAVSGTWPIRTEQLAGLKGGINALASSIVLVCRSKASGAPAITRRDFIAALKGPSPEERARLIAELERPGLSSDRRTQVRERLEENLPAALAHLQRSNIAPVDLAQAAIGPGMAVYTRYSKVLDASGQPLTVREALALINETLDEVLAEQEGDFDADTRWAVAWFEQSGFAEGEYGVADMLSKAKNTSVGGMVGAGILAAGRGKVRLLKPAELPPDWEPTEDVRLTVWEMVHHLIRALEKGGESAAAILLAQLGSKAEVARELAYRLYTLCERKKRAQEALSYNALVQSWPEITRLAREEVKVRPQQAGMFT
jgi:putative DNA methylase